ncbi:hypothetical protein L596_001309 [Steinernema carpocapsae]|uniref:Uncharacterized protein n=1 Tax=Steinernema carpocapsae TaxID=34508 RepID=A0A4U8UL70_STECR|nr:hypothetical protein L596_001309 [Steinernema carpocapsae]
MSLSRKLRDNELDSMHPFSKAEQDAMDQEVLDIVGDAETDDGDLVDYNRRGSARQTTKDRIAQLESLIKRIFDAVNNPVHPRFRMTLTIHWIRVYLHNNVTFDKNVSYEFAVTSTHGDVAETTGISGIGELEARGFIDIPLHHVFEDLPRGYETSVKIYALRIESPVKKSAWTHLRRLLVATPLGYLLGGASLHPECEESEPTSPEAEEFSLCGTLKLTQMNGGMHTTQLDDAKFLLEGTIDILSTLSLHPEKEGT